MTFPPPWPVLVTRRLAPGVLERLEPTCQLSVHDHDQPMDRAALLRDAVGQAGLLTTLADRIDAELLDAAGENLQVVANHAVGAHNIDLAACTARGVIVTTQGIDDALIQPYSGSADRA